MTKEIKLNAQLRVETNGKAKIIREKGLVPAVVYGSGTENRNVKIKKLDFERVFAEAGESNLIDLVIDDKSSVKVIVKDFQKSPITDQIIHVDFYQVDMSKKIETAIPLNFIGESKAVKELGAILMKNIDEINAKCLPGDLVNNIDVDLSVLNTLEDVIRIKDLKISKDVEILNDTEDMVASVTEQRAEEVEPEVSEEEAGKETTEGTEEKEKSEESEAPAKEKKE